MMRDSIFPLPVGWVTEAVIAHCARVADSEAKLAADWLRDIASDLRESGDVPLVRLSDDGVGPADISLADELWLVAFSLDPTLGERDPR